jgi:glycosyltransferase involved in cell wall biosynthesis
MRALAIFAVHNEARFIGGALEHLGRHGVEAYLCDNDSTDDTVTVASRHLGSTLRAIERIPRDGTYRWRSILQRKEELAATLDADWFLHLDADEIPLPPLGFATLHDALVAADSEGYDAIQADELTFVPTVEHPDHDHPDFRRTMRWYYPFAPRVEHLVRGWKRQSCRVDLAGTGGHSVGFPGRRIFPHRFRLCHYLFLSPEHAIRKYVRRRYDSVEVTSGWHGWRASLTPDSVHLPAAAELRETTAETDLDVSEPRILHCLQWER